MKQKVGPFILVMLVIAVAASSCHERGCTNASAINFNVTADEDDGSCIVCKDVVTPFDSMELDLIDNYNGSIHYNDVVARLYLTQEILSPSDKVCGTATCTTSLKIQSLVGQKMYLNYRVEDITGPVSFYWYNNLVLEPYASSNEGVIQRFNSTPFLQIGLDSLRAYPQNPITYY